MNNGWGIIAESCRGNLRRLFLIVGEGDGTANEHEWTPIFSACSAVVFPCGGSGCVEEGYDPGKARNTRKGFKGSIHL